MCNPNPKLIEENQAKLIVRNCYRSSGRLSIDSDSFHISSPYFFFSFFSRQKLFQS